VAGMGHPENPRITPRPAHPEPWFGLTPTGLDGIPGKGSRAVTLDAAPKVFHATSVH